MDLRFNLKNYSVQTLINRMVNTAFKKEEIRSPAKLPHHEMRLVEKQRHPKFGGGTYFSIRAGANGSPIFTATIALPMRKQSRGVGSSSEIPMEVTIQMHGLSRSGEMTLFAGSATVLMALVKAEQLEAYCTTAMRFVFDLAQSVRDPRELNGRSWGVVLNRCAQRHKWID